MSRERATGMFTRVSLAGTSLAIVTYCINCINLKQWSHYNDVTESEGVIHSTVYYRSLSDTLSTGPFDLFPRCSFGVGRLDYFPVWAQLELLFGFQVTKRIIILSLGRSIRVVAARLLNIFSSILMRQKHQVFFEHFSGIFLEN